MNFQDYKPTAELTKAVNNVLELRKEVERLRPIIEKIQTDVLAKFQFKVAEEHKCLEPDLDVILDIDESFLMSKADANIYYAELHKIYLANGYDVEAQGFCPLCIAKTRVMESLCKLTDAAKYIYPVNRRRTNYMKIRQFENLLIDFVTAYNREH